MDFLSPRPATRCHRLPHNILPFVAPFDVGTTARKSIEVTSRNMLPPTLELRKDARIVPDGKARIGLHE